MGSAELTLMEDVNASASRVRYLDAWRGWAIICVLLGHFVVASGLNFGRFGVELFFALSGSLIGDILFVKKTALKTYGLKRFARIVPSLWVFLASVSAGFWLSGISLPWFEVVSAGLGFANYCGPSMLVFQHLWSVSLELQGYLVLGGIAYVCRSIRLLPHLVIAALVAVSWAAVYVAAFHGEVEYYSTFWRFEFRCSSMLIAAALVSYGVARIRYLPPWWTFLVIGLFLFYDGVPDVVKYTFGSAVVAIACVHMRNAIHHTVIFDNKLVVELGLASYSIYLWQQVFFSQKGWLGKPLSLALAVFVGYSAYKIIDDRLHRGVLNFLMRGAGHGRDETKPA